MKVRNYEVGKLIGESSKIRIYLGKTEENETVIIKVAKTFEDGDLLAREASDFNLLRAFEGEVSRLQQELKGTAYSHYDWLFAQILNSFMEPSQDDRRINVYRVLDVDVERLTPLVKLHEETMIDYRSGIWMLGRLFKLYGFYELLALSGDNPVVHYPIFNPGDYLIAPREHRLVYYNYSGSIDDVVAYDSVKSIAKFLWEDWMISSSDEDSEESKRDEGSEESKRDEKFSKLMESFATEGRESFEEAHRELYRFVGEHYGIRYHPFTYRKRGSAIYDWQTIKEG